MKKFSIEGCEKIQRTIKIEEYDEKNDSENKKKNGMKGIAKGA